MKKTNPKNPLQPPSPPFRKDGKPIAFSIVESRLKDIETNLKDLHSEVDYLTKLLIVKSNNPAVNPTHIVESHLSTMSDILFCAECAAASLNEYVPRLTLRNT